MKKAVSNLVATVLLVLITIAAVGIIWGAIMPMIKGNIEKSQRCYDVGLELKKTGNTCFYRSDGILEIQVAKGEKVVELIDIQIQIGSSGTTKSIRVRNSTAVIGNSNVIPGPNEDVKYTINTTELGISDVDYASVAAILKIGNIESICASSPSTSIELC